MKEQLPSAPDALGSVSSGPQKDSNGQPVGYKQSLSKSSPPRKQEIEAQLQSRSEAIASRLEAIQSEFSATSSAIKSVAESPLTGLLLAFGAGLIVGRVFRGSDNRDSGANDLAAILSQQVESAIAAGEPPDDAVRRVLDATGLPGENERASGGTLKWIAGIALRSLVTQGLRGASSFFGTSDTGGLPDDAAIDALD